MSKLSSFHLEDLQTTDPTRMDDLGPGDRVLVRRLASQFLLAQLASLGIAFTRRKPEGTKRSGGLWSASLESLLERDRKLHAAARIPIVYDEILNCLENRGLEVEGILRIPGAAARIRAVREHLEKQYNAGTDKFDWGEVRVNDVVALMKQFLRELPQPLLTNELVEAFVVVGKLEDEEVRRRLLNLLILALPDVHRDCLERLLLFLGRVVAREDKNKMSLSSVATIVAPNLFLPPRVSRSRSYRIDRSEVDLAQDTASVVETLIRRREELWTVSETVMEALRALHASPSRGADTSDRPFVVKKLICGCFGSLTPRPKSPEELDRELEGRKIRLFLATDDADTVHATDENLNLHVEEDATPVINVLSRKASLERTVTCLHLEPTTTAGQVVAQFCRLHGVDRSTSEATPLPGVVPGVTSLYNDPEELTSLFLFEVGGNIGERRLHPDAVVKEALGKNPHAKWIVKPRMLLQKL